MGIMICHMAKAVAKVMANAIAMPLVLTVGITYGRTYGRTYVDTNSRKISLAYLSNAHEFGKKFIPAVSAHA